MDYRNTRYDAMTVPLPDRIQALLPDGLITTYVDSIDCFVVHCEPDAALKTYYLHCPDGICIAALEEEEKVEKQLTRHFTQLGNTWINKFQITVLRYRENELTAFFNGYTHSFHRLAKMSESDEPYEMFLRETGLTKIGELFQIPEGDFILPRDRDSYLRAIGNSRERCYVALNNMVHFYRSISGKHLLQLSNGKTVEMCEAEA
jgi:hypothetical protein